MVCVINVVTVRRECMRIETNIHQCVKVRANRQRDMKRRITYLSFFIYFIRLKLISLLVFEFLGGRVVGKRKDLLR